MKAVVMETREKEAAVLLQDGTFRVVKGKYQVGETIEYRERKSAFSRKWMSIAAAAVLMVGAGGGLWYDANYVAYAEISVDVNPSIVYTVNKRSRVLEVRAVNDEASETVTALQKEGVRFMPVDEAIEKTMTFFEEEGYLSTADEDYVLLNVSADDSHMQESLVSFLETGMDQALKINPTMEFRIDRSDRETARRAFENHMSTGRYAIWEQEGGERKPEEYADMPIREVMGKPAPEAPAAQGPDAQPGDDHPSDSGSIPAQPAAEVPDAQGPDAQPGDALPSDSGSAPAQEPSQAPAGNAAQEPLSTMPMGEAVGPGNQEELRPTEPLNDPSPQPPQDGSAQNPEPQPKPDQGKQTTNQPLAQEVLQPPPVQDGPQAGPAAPPTGAPPGMANAPSLGAPSGQPPM